MTREEAIKLLEHISIAYTPTDAYGDYDDPQPYEEAFDMAIEALQTDEVWIIKTGQTHGKSAYIKELAEVVRCKDCRYFKKIVERSDSGLCHRDIVASAWKENGYCSRGERKGGDGE